jgi:hypothetical protein
MTADPCLVVAASDGYHRAGRAAAVEINWQVFDGHHGPDGYRLLATQAT